MASQSSSTQIEAQITKIENKKARYTVWESEATIKYNNAVSRNIKGSCRNTVNALYTKCESHRKVISTCITEINALKQQLSEINTIVVQEEPIKVVQEEPIKVVQEEPIKVVQEEPVKVVQEEPVKVETTHIEVVVDDVSSVETTDPIDITNEEITVIPTLKETYYFEAGSKDKVKAVCELSDVLVSKDSNDKGAKAYQCINWNKWIKRATRFDCHEYECLRGNVLPYMDIESEKEDIDVVDMLNHSIGIFIEALLANGLQINGVAIANSSRPGKHSFHVVIHTDKVFESAPALKQFVETQVQPLFGKGGNMDNLLWSRINKKTNQEEFIPCIDWKVYTTDRVIRFLNQSKLGKKVRLTPYVNEDIIVPCPFLTAPVDFLIGQYGQSEAKEVFIVEMPEHIQKAKVAKEGGVVTPTIVVPPSQLDELASLVPSSIIQNGTTCCKFIWAMTRSGASRDLVHKHCQRTDNYDSQWVDGHIKRAEKMNVNIGTLRYWAIQADKTAFHAFAKKYMKDEIVNEIHTFNTTIKHDTYHERFVRPFSFDKVDTLILKSHLGTGKTTQLVESIKPKKNFLQQSTIPFKRILIISGRKSFTKFITGDLEECGLGFKAYDDNHFGPLANINRLVIQVESLWRLEDSFHKYDLVAVDESETVAHQFYSEATHRNNMITNHIMFERCITSATKVWFADAFISNRTIKIAEALRNTEHSLFVENTYCPYDRIAQQLISINPKTKKAVPALSAFCNSIMDDLSNGMKVAVIWGSKNKAKAFAKQFLEDSTYKWRLYTSESSAEERNELSNVKENWKDIDCLNYTSTITVGVNYDPEELTKCFDKLYLYAAASGGLPRDIAQALLRCRKIKTNTLVYTVDNNALQIATYGRDAIRVAIQEKQSRLITANPVITWERAPKWAEDNYIENENENGAKCMAFNEILNGYLKQSGYSLTTKNVTYDEIGLSNDSSIMFDDIPTVADEIIEKIKRKSKAGLASLDEKHILQKHRFCKQLNTTDNTILSTIWSDYMTSISTESFFWNQVNEKHQTTDEYLEHECTQRYIQNSSKKCQKRIVLDKVLNVIGIKNTSEQFTIESIDTIMDKLKVIEEDVFKVFQPHASRRKGDFKNSTAADMLKMVFSVWTGRKINVERKRKGCGGKTIVYSVSNVPSDLWEHITKKDVEVE